MLVAREDCVLSGGAILSCGSWVWACGGARIELVERKYCELNNRKELRRIHPN